MRYRLILATLAVALCSSAFAHAQGTTSVIMDDTVKAPAAAETTPDPTTGDAISREAYDPIRDVEMQNLTCDEINRFRTITAKNGVVPQTNPNGLLIVAEAILDEPQHSQDDSDTLFGPVLTAQIFDSTGGTFTCKVIVPVDAPPGARTCRGDGVNALMDRSQNSLLTPSNNMANFPGQIKILGTFDQAAKLRNCRT